MLTNSKLQCGQRQDKVSNQPCTYDVCVYAICVLHDGHFRNIQYCMTIYSTSALLATSLSNLILSEHTVY